jgi:hypothetical protein
MPGTDVWWGHVGTLRTLQEGPVGSIIEIQTTMPTDAAADSRFLEGEAQELAPDSQGQQSSMQGNGGRISFDQARKCNPFFDKRRLTIQSSSFR